MSKIHEIGGFNTRDSHCTVDANTLGEYVGYDLVRLSPLRISASYSTIKSAREKKGYTIVVVENSWPFYNIEKISLPPGTKVVVSRPTDK